MKTLQTLLIALLSIPSLIYSQQNTLIDLSTSNAFAGVAVSKGVISLTKLENQLIIVFPQDPSRYNYSVQFNSDKNKFVISFDKSHQPAAELVLITDADLVNNQLVVKFQNGFLMSVGDTPPAHKGFTVYNRAVPAEKPYIKIIVDTPAKAAPAKSVIMQLDPPKGLAQTHLDPPATNADMNHYYCSAKQCPTCNTTKDSCSPQTIQSRFNQKFLKPCIDKGSKAYTPRYRIFYDLFGRPTLLESVEDPISEHFKVVKNLKLKTGDWLEVVGEQDSDSAALSFNATGSSDFAAPPASLLSFLGGSSEVAATPAATGNAQASAGSKTVQAAAVVDDLKKLLGTKIDSLKDLSLANKLGFLRKAKIISDEWKTPPAKGDGSETQLDNMLKDFFDELSKDLNTNAQGTDELKKCNDDLKKLQDQLAVLAQETSSVTLMGDLQSLETALEKFNGDFANIDYIQDAYAAAKLCLQLNIKKNLGIVFDGTANSLDSALVSLSVTKVTDKQYYADFAHVIGDIHEAYDLAVNKKGKQTKYYANSFQVSNDDHFTVAVKAGTTQVRSDMFDTYGGWKIDFSSGLFINGLATNNYILGNHSFRYKVTRDSVLPSGTDSIVYLGNVRDTSGNLVQSNTSKISYGVGFLIHFYKRSRRALDWGGVFGFDVSDNNPILLMGGLSTMVKCGSSRIALSGGACLGPIKRLSSEAAPYQWSASKEPDNKLYNSVYDMPRFYTGSNDIPTYSSWRLSWYIGLTFNFASLNLSGTSSTVSNISK